MSSNTAEVSSMGGSSKYAKNFVIPPEFPDLLRNLTREILRNQPSDINQFALEYFAALLQERTAADAASDAYGG